MDKTRQILVDYAHNLMDYCEKSFGKYGITLDEIKLKNLSRYNVSRYRWLEDENNGTYFDFQFLIKFDEPDITPQDSKIFTNALKEICDDFFYYNPYPIKGKQIEKIDTIECEPFGDNKWSTSNAWFIFTISLVESYAGLDTWGNSIEDVAKGLGNFKPTDTYLGSEGYKYKVKVKLSEPGYFRKKLSYTGTFKYWDRFKDLHINLRHTGNILALQGLYKVAEYIPNPDIILIWSYRSREYPEDDYQAYLIHRKDFDVILQKWQNVITRIDKGK